MTGCIFGGLYTCSLFDYYCILGAWKIRRHFSEVRYGMWSLTIPKIKTHFQIALLRSFDIARRGDPRDAVAVVAPQPYEKLMIRSPLEACHEDFPEPKGLYCGPLCRPLSPALDQIFRLPTNCQICLPTTPCVQAYP